MNDIEKTGVVAVIERLSQQIHSTAKDKGWWTERDYILYLITVAREEFGNDPAKDVAHATATIQLSLIALITSELSEATEAIRAGNPPDDKIPEFNGATAECADAIIRILDMCAKYNWPIGKALIAKMDFNAGRSHKHGGKVV